MKYIGENAIKKLISLIKVDLATKQDSITATGVLERDTAGAINGVETVGATLVETQEAKLVDVPNGLLKGDGTTISAAVAGTDYVNSNQAIRYDAAQSLTDAQKQQARGNIAAAPDGFGLGKAPKDIADANDAINNGWYDISADTLNLPAEGNWNYTYLRVDVGNRPDTYIKQTITSPFQRWHQCEVTRCFYDVRGGWQPWEWVNPPMLLGVEYRTTERYLGKPVYVKLINLGNLPNKTQVSIQDTSIGGIAHIVDFKGEFINSSGTPFLIPYGPDYAGSGKYTVSIPVVSQNTAGTGIEIRVYTTVDFSAFSATALVKYTKVSD